MLLGIIGHPLVHSQSPEIFKRFFLEEGLADADYRLFPIENIAEVPAMVTALAQLQGFNVTIPHKKSIIPYLNEISPEAEKIGAVNTVKIHRTDEGVKMKGYNTDYYGFKTTLLQFLNGLVPKKALVLGTGGSSNTVAYTLHEMGIPYIKVSRAGNTESLLSYEDVTPEILQHYPLIINTTPLGMYPSEKTYPHIPYGALTSFHYLYDLVYNPDKTLFLQKGEEQGAHIQNGRAMLELQAQKAWEIWRG